MNEILYMEISTQNTERGRGAVFRAFLMESAHMRDTERGREGERDMVLRHLYKLVHWFPAAAKFSTKSVRPASVLSTLLVLSTWLHLLANHASLLALVHFKIYSFI